MKNRLLVRVVAGLFILAPGTSFSEVNCQSGAPAISQERLFTDGNAYFLREDCYAELPFETGDFVVIEPPSETLVRLFVPTHKGVPRVGALPHYGGGTFTDKTRFMKEAVSQRLILDSGIYNNLVVAQLNAEHFTEDALLQEDGSGLPQNKRRRPDRLPTVTDVNGGAYSARLHMQSFAASTQSVDSANTFRCATNPEQPCYTGFSRGPGWNWGGGQATEFAARRSYEKYVREEIPKIKTWAATVTTEAYLVDTVLLPNYDFDRGGYAVKPRNVYGVITHGQYDRHSQVQKLMFMYQPVDKANRLFDNTGLPTTPGIELFMPVGIDDAEKMQNEVKQLYAVMKVRLYGMYRQTQRSMGAPGTNSLHYGRPMLFDIVEPRIEYFTDSLLTNKIFELSLK